MVQDTPPSSSPLPESCVPRLVVTPGEPAGIGTDIVLMAAQRPWPAELVCVADHELLAARAHALDLPIRFRSFNTGQPPVEHTPGELCLVDIPTAEPARPGVLQPANASYVLATLNLAAELCRSGDADAMVTAPVQKSIINEAGIPFSGHTEFLAELTHTEQVVMMLAANSLRVALVTTHLPLAEVPAAVTSEHLQRVLEILLQALTGQFGIADPRVTVLGLNPHAGEGGHMGREEIDIIEPVITTLRGMGHKVSGPLPADTAFQPSQQEQTDAYLAMYHDQGLPVLKFAGFGDAVNITLGLPFPRTSVDHGTALPLAGTGEASPTSLYAAIDAAAKLTNRIHP